MSEAEARAPHTDMFAATPVWHITSSCPKIAHLNKQKSFSFREGLELKVGGQDVHSRKKLPQLQEEVGAACAAVVDASLHARRPTLSDDERVQLTERALRWCLRGLGANHAVHKVLIDDEVSANAHSRSLPRPGGRG